jgi:hypothetical protein
MIEKVAIAVADYLRHRPLETTERVLATGGAIEIAKIAIAAMREPTDDMIVAGAQTYQGVTYSGIPSWEAMIAAALGEAYGVLDLSNPRIGGYMGDSAADTGHENLARLLQIMAPGDNDVVAVMEAYFDESDSDDRHALLSVSGYIFTKDQCLQLDQEWADILAEAGKPGPPLPYFRMSACAHGRKPFDKVGKQGCDKAARRAINVIRSHMSYGFSASISQKDYALWLPPDIRASAYTWCCHTVLLGIRIWADRVGFYDDIAYFFEAGHAHQSEANGVMNRVFRDDRYRKAYRYGGHAFVPKEKNRPVQTADVLAWHHVQEEKRRLEGRRTRLDFRALVEERDQYIVAHGKKEMFDDPQFMAQFRDFVRERPPTMRAQRREG